MSSFRFCWLGVLALLLSCEDAEPSVTSYVASVRTATPPANEDADAKATREAIAQSLKLSIDNWAEHPHTATGCYWGTLAMPDRKEVPVGFLVTRAENGAWSVARASITKHCQCNRGTPACYMDK